MKKIPYWLKGVILVYSFVIILSLILTPIWANYAEWKCPYSIGDGFVYSGENEETSIILCYLIPLSIIFFAPLMILEMIVKIPIPNTLMSTIFVYVFSLVFWTGIGILLGLLIRKIIKKF